GLVLVIAAVEVAAFGCGSSIGDVCDLPGACGQGQEGGQPDGGGLDGDASNGQDGPTSLCDPSEDPKDDPDHCVTEAEGVFVNAAADDVEDGTKAHAYRTIRNALQNLAGKTRVFVCAGSYTEHVSLTKSQDGVKIYGHWSCDNWSYSTSNEVTIKPSSTGP